MEASAVMNDPRATYCAIRIAARSGKDPAKGSAHMRRPHRVIEKEMKHVLAEAEWKYLLINHFVDATTFSLFAILVLCYLLKMSPVKKAPMK